MHSRLFEEYGNREDDDAEAYARYAAEVQRRAAEVFAERTKPREAQHKSFHRETWVHDDGPIVFKTPSIGGGQLSE